jgi:hypothetical protein
MEGRKKRLWRNGYLLRCRQSGATIGQANGEEWMMCDRFDYEN